MAVANAATPSACTRLLPRLAGLGYKAPHTMDLTPEQQARIVEQRNWERRVLFPIVGGVVVAALAGYIGWQAARQQQSPASEAGSEVVGAATGSFAAPEPAPAPAPETRQPTLLELVSTTDVLTTAVKLVLPYFADTTDGPSSGAAVLAMWMAADNHAAQALWPQGAPAPLTLKMAKKDITSARGAIICVRGNIVQIARDESVPDPLHVGTMMVGDGMDFVHFLAGGNTGTLVDGDTARFCGVVTGRFHFKNVSGGETQSIQLVGTFDIQRARAR